MNILLYFLHRTNVILRFYYT